MLNSKKIQICDPLYGHIHFDNGEQSLINHPAFQRLREIQQLGFSQQAFPSGTGNRFSHSLGVCHLAGVAFDNIFEKLDLICETKKEVFKKTVRIAALLHDIGHGPLSHSSESLMPCIDKLELKQYLQTNSSRKARHEDYSVKFIMEQDFLYKPIEQYGIEPTAVAQLLHQEFMIEENFFIENGMNFLPILRQIISSDFDVDRMDYLNRDSLSCGVKYGLIDFMWLLSQFDYHIEENNVYLSICEGGLYTLESFILGRQHMRMIVYFHRKSSIYNQMLKRYAEDCEWKLPTNLQDYILFTDARLFDKLRKDDNPWAKRIIDQNPYKRLYEYVFFDDSSKQKEKRIGLSLRAKLKKEKISFIDIDSERHSIKPDKKPTFKYPIYLKNEVLNQTKLLYKDTSLLSLPPRNIHRIYIDIDQYPKAQEILNKQVL